MSAAEREELRAAVLEGLAMARKFRGVPHEQVRRWLLSLERAAPILQEDAALERGEKRIGEPLRALARCARRAPAL